MSLNLKVKFIDSENITPSGICRLELLFSSNTIKNILINEIFVNFENYCLINILNLKRYKKQNDVDIFLQKLKSRYEAYNDNSKGDSNQLIISKSSNKVVLNGIIKSEESYKLIIKIQIPDESAITYKSKSIQFWSIVNIRATSENCQINLDEFNIPIKVVGNRLHGPRSTAESVQEINPFEVNENSLQLSPVRDFQTEMLLDRHTTAKYRITYQNSVMCYLTLLKSHIYIGDDITIILNFVPNSEIRCIKFAVSLKVNEILLIPNECSENVEKISLSSKEFGPFQHNSMFIEILTVSVKVPNDQFPSMESDIFQINWFLEFKFMITNSEEVSLKNIDKGLSNEVISWQPDHKQADLLRWELPLQIYQQMNSDI